MGTHTDLFSVHSWTTPWRLFPREQTLQTTEGKEMGLPSGMQKAHWTDAKCLLG